jgi:hypothetical protein
MRFLTQYRLPILGCVVLISLWVGFSLIHRDNPKLSPAVQRTNPPAAAQDPANAAAFVRLTELLTKIQKRKRLSKSDALFLEGAINRGPNSLRERASLDLDAAVRRHLYSKKKLLTMIETQSSTRGAPLFFLMDYRSTLGIEMAADRTLNEGLQKILGQQRSSNRFDPEEMLFIKEALHHPFQSNRILAAYIFYEKEGLDPEGFSWMTQLIADQIRTAAEDPKLFWQYIGRITAIKNGGTSPAFGPNINSQ